MALDQQFHCWDGGLVWKLMAVCRKADRLKAQSRESRMSEVSPRAHNIHPACYKNVRGMYVNLHPGILGALILRPIVHSTAQVSWKLQQTVLNKEIIERPSVLFHLFVPHPVLPVPQSGRVRNRAASARALLWSLIGRITSSAASIVEQSE